MRRFAAQLGLATLVAAIVRLILARPTFLHANFHGSMLVEAILNFPEGSGGRDRTYGHFGFLLLGLVARLFGRRFEVVCAANQLFSAATLFLMAWMAYRYTQDRRSAWWVLALGWLHVAMVRVAASEDAHNLAVLLGWIALFGLDVYAESKKRLWLLVATLAIVAMIHTRQTLYPLVPCLYGLALARGGRGLWRRGEFLASLAAVAAAVALRVITTLSVPSEQTSFIIIGLILATPRLVLHILVHHPLFDIFRFHPLVPVLLLAGAWIAWRRGGPLRASTLSFALCFLVSFATAWHTPGVELAFRLPAVSLGILLCGVGGAAIFTRWALIAVAALVPLCLPSFHELRQQSADFLEYRFAEEAASQLPREFVLVTPSVSRSAPSWTPPLGPLRRAGVNVTVGGRDPSLPRLFLSGVECWGWSMGELIGLDDPAKVTREQLSEWGTAVVDGDLSRLKLPDHIRPECQTGTPIGPEGSIDHPLQDEPFVIYGVDSIPLRFYRLDGS
jgi:hypothetical protein